MNKTELIEQIARATGESKAVTERVLNGFAGTVQQELAKGGDVALVGFGAFKVTHRKARKGVNPQNGAEVDIAACNVVKFSAGKALREAVNN